MRSYAHRKILNADESMISQFRAHFSAIFVVKTIKQRWVGFKMAEDRITALFISNTKGTKEDPKKTSLISKQVQISFLLQEHEEAPIP